MRRLVGGRKRHRRPESGARTRPFDPPWIPDDQARFGGIWGRGAFASLFICAAFLTLPASAPAHTTITCEPCFYPYQQWVDEAKVPTPEATVAVVGDSASCPGEAFGCTGPGLPIRLDTSWGTWRDQRFFFLHELGHVFDYLVMPDWARAKFEVLIGDYDRPWTEDPNGPNEKFGEAFALCALRPRLRHTPPPYGYGYRPTPRLQPRVCLLIWAASLAGPEAA